MSICQVFRHPVTKEIERVLAPNGKESKLYSDILKLTNNEEDALRLWAQVYTPTFKEWFGDWEMLERAKSLKDNINGFYKSLFIEDNYKNVEQVLFEAAVQANSSPGEKRGAIKVFGEELVNIAQQMFTNVKVGDKFQSKISKVVDENGEPLIVWHGGNKIDSSFSSPTTASHFGKGIYFASKESASNYLDLFEVKIKTPSLTPAFLNVRNPYMADDSWGPKIKSRERNFEELFTGKDGVIFKSNLTEGKRTIKSVINNDNTPVGKDFNDEYVAFNPSQIKSVLNDGNFSTGSDNIYQSKPEQLKDRILRYLQFNDIVTKNKLGNEYFIKKTGKYDDPNLYKPEETERKNLDKINMINEKLGYQAITIERKGNAYKVSIDIQTNLNFNFQDLIKESMEGDYTDYIVNKLFQSDTPAATDLIYNAMKVAEEINDPDLIRLTRFISSFIIKNPQLTIRVEKSFINEKVLTDFEKKNSLGYYNPNLNEIAFNLDMLSKSSLYTILNVINEELIHSITVAPFYTPSQIRTKEEEDYVDKINTLYTYYKSKSGDPDLYRFKNVGEFIVGLSMDTSFQDHILEIEKVNNQSGLFQTIMNWLLRAISGLFGIQYDMQASRDSISQKAVGPIISYLKSVSDIFDERAQRYSFYSMFPSIGRANISEKRLGDTIESFRKNIDQIRRTGVVNKLNEQQKIAIEGIRKDLNAITQEDVNKMLLFSEYLNDLNNIIKTNLNQIKQIENSETMTADQKLASLHTVMATTKAFDISIDSISKMKRFLDDDEIGLNNTVDSLLSNRTAITSIYNDIILPIVLDKYDNIFEYSVLENNMALDKELDFKRGKLANAEAKGNNGLVNVLKKEVNDIIEKKKKLLPTRQRIEDLLTGKAKDVNFTSMYMEAWAINGDPTVSGLVDYVKRQFQKSAASLQVLGNKFQNEINEYKKAIGKGTNNPEKLHEDIIETVKQVESYDGKEFTYKERLALVNQYNKEYIKDAQEFVYKLNSLQERLRATRDAEHRAQIIEQLRALRKEQRQWEKDFMERPYTDFYYKVFETLHEDLGGFTAAEALHDIDEKLFQVEKAIRTTTNEDTLDDLYLQKEDILRERKRLYSIYNKPIGSKEKKIADQLTKYKEESRKLADYKLTAKAIAKFTRDIEKLNDKYKSGQISDKEYKRWLDENTVQEHFTDEFWKKFNEAITKLNDIMEKLGVKKDKNIAELYAEVRNLANIYRNTDGIIEGEDVKKEEALHIKSIQEKIEELKQNAEDIMGLTKQEKKRYYELLHISNDPYISDSEWDKYREEWVALSSKKKKASKSLMKQYFEAIKEINDLSESVETPNYFEEYQRQFDLFVGQMETEPIPVKFMYEDELYTKKGNSWFNTAGIEATNPDYLYKSSKALYLFEDSEWYKNNHMKVNKFVTSDAPGERGGQYIEVHKPIYIWMKMEPKDKGYIVKVPEPGFKYRERIVKDEFVNKHYRESIDGYNQPRLIGPKDDRYINKNYQAMSRSNDPIQKANMKYLNFLSEVHLENQKHLPQSQRIGYFLPSLRKDWIESIQTGDYSAKSIYEKLGQLTRRAMETAIVTEQDKDTMFGYVNADNDLLPVRMTGSIDIKDQSRDATRSIMMFAANNLDYKNLNDSLPFVNAIKDIVSNTEHIPVAADTSGNVIMRTIKGKFFGVKKSGSNRARLIDEVYRTYYLGERKKQELAAKFIDKSLGYAAKMMLNLNPTSLFSNFANAEIQKVLVTGMDGFFTAKQYGKSYAIYSSIITDLIRDSVRVGNKSYHNQLVDHYGGINDEFRTQFGKDLKFTGLRNTVSSIMTPTSIAENEIANTVFIAVALNFKVKQGNNYISMYDAYELDKTGNLIPKQGVTIDEETHARFRRRLTAALRKVNGNYNALDASLAEKYTAGRMIFFMNKFYVPFFAQRWGGERYDFETDTITKGYYRLFLQRFMRDIKSFNYNMIANWSSMSPQQRSAYKRVGIEILVSSICMALIAALGGQDPDDLKRNGLLQNNLIYQLNIIRSQNESFIPFPTLGLNEMINRVKNPFPLMTKITNAGKVLQDGFLTLLYPIGLSDEKDVFYTTKTGWHEPGDSKVMADLDRLFGIFYRFKNLAHPEIAIRNFQNAQRIK